MRKVFVETYGCQMNEYDTELVRGILSRSGYELVDQDSAADIVLLNTCAVRENAHRKVFGKIHDIRHQNQGRPLMIGILGCMATNLRQDLLDDKNLKIDFIAGPDSYKRLPALIQQASEKGEKAFDLTLSEFETYSDVYPHRESGVNAWIAVMRGCNNFCTFCVVPYTRGRERSRSVDNVVEEVRRVVAEGFKQVTLLGQNVNSYHHDGAAFADPLGTVSRVEGLKRIRFTSPHPKDFPDPLLAVVASNPKVCQHIHLPLQAGHNRILDLMDRTYTREEFLALVDKIRRVCPSIVLTTDIIAGFPSETSSEFEETVAVVKQVRFDAAFIFKYSPRQGTIAMRKYPDDVPEDEKTRRVVMLNDLQKEISLQKNQAHIGEIHEILIDRDTDSHGKDQEYHGRNDGNKGVLIPAGPYQKGDCLKIKIVSASPHILRGVPLDPSS